jgi:hypothetical protein
VRQFTVRRLMPRVLATIPCHLPDTPSLEGFFRMILAGSGLL